jgi:hypothetical protein
MAALSQLTWSAHQQITTEHHYSAETFHNTLATLPCYNYIDRGVHGVFIRSARMSLKEKTEIWG